MSEIRFRKITERDIEEILELERRFPPRSRESLTRERILELMKKNPNACIVAEENWKIVGAIFGEVKREECKIVSLIIDIDKLGEDISTKLIKELLTSTGVKNITK